MAEEKFETNLLRLIAAELYYLAGIQTAREMYSKSYFALGAGEKSVVDQMVLTQIGTNLQGMTPEALRAQESAKGAGFQIPAGGQMPKS